jgi:hypothetical protein
MREVIAPTLSFPARVQTSAVGASERDERPELRGSQRRDARLLQFGGNLLAQLLGHVQAAVADNARGPQEQCLQFQ